MNLVFAVPLGVVTGPDLGARFRLSTEDGLGAEGIAPDGEVEDYLLQVRGLDFGDAPDPTYATLSANDGARHVIGGLFLGAGVDPDGDGQPNVTAKTRL